MSLKTTLREYFTFNKRERNGVFVLLIIITLLLLFLSLSDLFLSNEKVDISRFDKEIAEFAAQETQIEDSLLAHHSNYNNISQYHSISNHRKLYQNASDSNVSDSTVTERKHTGNIHELQIELNSADTTELKKLKGIGSSFAKRIVKYREILGGYAAKEQLLEVYGFDKEKYKLVSPHVFVDTNLVKKININTSSIEEMKTHPYIRWKLASTIFYYRKNHGNYPTVESIKRTDVVSDSLFLKIAPYLAL